MSKKTGIVKLAKLRELLEAAPIPGTTKKGIQAVIINSCDAHQSEYICPQDERRAYISGFKGSAGDAVITKDKALMWTDGRYYTQALLEFDPPEAWTLMKRNSPETPTLAEWLVSNLPVSSTVGADPILFSNETWTPLAAALTIAGHKLLPLDENLVDKVWSDEKPAAEDNDIVPQPIEFTGRTASDKIEECRKAMSKKNVDMMLVTALDDIAYALNLRGSDIPYNPVFFSYLIIDTQEVHLFVNPPKASQGVIKEHLSKEGLVVHIHPYDQVRNFLKSASASKKIWIADSSSYALHHDCGEAVKCTEETPIFQMKSLKNDVEVEAMRETHLHDSVALVQYFAWLKNQVKSGQLVTEISGATRLEEFRSQRKNFIRLSFPTISSVGKHGAIIHYSPSPETDCPITDKEMYLCDSGAHYYGGTTDVTRTWHFGTPTDYEKECFTLVFKGQCRLSSAIFPDKINGHQLDCLARQSLWDVGLNYAHGTGHGVGAYLCVHEMTTSISWRNLAKDIGLQSGVFISNEPGYYEEGKFGIRHENVELVRPATTKYKTDGKEFLRFETMTLVPIQTSCMDLSLLTEKEIKYLNDYHERCLKSLSPHLQGPENEGALKWLIEEAKPISK